MQTITLNKKAYLKRLIISFLVLWAIALFPILKYSNLSFLTAFAVGSLISFANSIASFVVINRGLSKETKEFLKLTLGSMAVRLFAIAAVIFVLLKFFGLNIYGLIISLFLFYFVFMALEIIFLNSSANKKEAS